MNAEDFEARAIALKETETDLLRQKAQLAAIAVEADSTAAYGSVNAARWLAHLWATSTQYVHGLAAMWKAIPPEMITPDVPLNLYRAAMETDSPIVWLQRALDKGWSSRRLRDEADIAKGKHVSRVLLADHEADVVMWEGGSLEGYPTAHIELDVPNLEPSGEPPQRVRFKAWEVLDD
jgi:hypothetical protein